MGEEEKTDSNPVVREGEREEGGDKEKKQELLRDIEFRALPAEEEKFLSSNAGSGAVSVKSVSRREVAAIFD